MISFHIAIATAFICSTSLAFDISLLTFKNSYHGTTSLRMADVGLPLPGRNYDPKWKKQKTLAEKNGGPQSFDEIGLDGTIPVLFKEGDKTRTTMAMVGQPIQDVASQAGQYIKYGCGKGECGSCEALCNGKWIRPCVAVIPSDAIAGEDFIITVKGVKNTSKSSGKFYSIRSFLFGFYNNVLGMVGFVTTRKAARKNLDDRLSFEDMVAQKTKEKKAARAAAKTIEVAQTEKVEMFSRK